MSLQEAVKFVAGAYGVSLAVLFAAYALTARRSARLARELQGVRAALEQFLAQKDHGED
jgi:hypothetical protein